jgi:tetratricopeptide (TPR) repeat protein
MLLATALLLGSHGVSQERRSQSDFETLAAQALAARQAGKTDEAVQNYRAGVELRPDWEEGWWYLGTLLYDSDHFSEAIPALHHLVGLDSSIGAGWAFLGLCEFEAGDYPNAFDHLQKAEQLGFSESPESEKVALYHLALLLNARGEFENASELVAREFGTEPVPEQIKTALGLSLLRVPLLPTEVDTGKDALVHSAGETAAVLLIHGVGEASQSFESMLKNYPDTPYLHYAYGVALGAASQDSRAESQFREEIRAFPHEPLPWIALSKLETRWKNLAQATTAAKQATQADPQSAAAYFTLGEALQAEGKQALADDAFKQARKFSKQPSSIEAAQIERYAPAGIARTKSQAKQTTAGPESTADLTNIAKSAESARQAGHLEEATVLYAKAVKYYPGWQEGWRQLGTLCYMQGRYAEAIPALQKSVAREPKQADTWTLLGLSEFETRDYNNAKIHLERGRSLGFSGNAAAVRISRYHLAQLLNLNGDFDGALALLIAENRPGPLADEIQFAMGVALLRMPVLSSQIDPAKRALVRSAGEAALLLSQSYYDKAFPILDQLLAENPTTLFLHYAYGDALASISRYDAAQLQLQQEIRLNPGNELAYIRLASIALVLHQSANALENSRKAAELAPGSSEAHYVFGRALLETGDVTGAIRELTTASRLAPTNSKIHFNLARAYARADRMAEAQQEREEFERLNHQMAGQAHSLGDPALRDSPEQPVQPRVNDESNSHSE